MKISTKGRYGLRALVDLANHMDGGFVSLARITERQNLSVNYLEQVFSALKKAKLVVGMTGAGGGYRLARPPEGITVEMVLEVLEGDLSIVDKPLGRQSPFCRCICRHLWDKVDGQVTGVIRTTTIKSLMDAAQPAEEN